MAGQAKHISKNEEIDPKYLTLGNNFGSGGYARNTATSSLRQINQSMKTKNGIFNGAFGNIQSSLNIASGVLNMTYDSNGLITKKRVIHVNPETGTTDTLRVIDSEDEELPYQELIMIGVNGDTITIKHDDPITGTEKEILCPDDTDYTLENDAWVYLIYDSTLDKWILLGGGSGSGSGDNLGNHTATQDLNMGNFNIDNIGNIYNGNGTGSALVLGSNVTLSATGDLSLSDANGVFLTSDNTVPAVEIVETLRPFDSTVDLGDTSKKWRNLYLQGGFNNSKVYFDGGGDTYITGSGSTGRINHFADGSIVFYTDPTECVFDVNLSMNSNDIVDIQTAIFNNTGIPSASEVAIGATTGDMYLNVLTNDSYFFRQNGSTICAIDDDGVDIRGGWLQLDERADPSGSVDHARLFAKDNGSGKTQLCVKFFTGAVQVIATEP